MLSGKQYQEFGCVLSGSLDHLTMQMQLPDHNDNKRDKGLTNYMENTYECQDIFLRD